MDSKLIILVDPYEYNAPTNVFKNRNKETHYAFDIAFNSSATQNDVFNNTTKALIDGVLSGYNGTVFAYGATGAGKTYT